MWKGSYWSWFLLLDQNLQKMRVFLTLHHEEMCVLDVYVQSKRQDNIKERNPLQR